MTDETIQVRCVPKAGVVKATPRLRAVAKLARAVVDREPADAAEADLVGDTFLSFYQSGAEVRENVAPDRVVNKAIVEWMMANDTYRKRSGDLAGDMIASEAAAGLTWQVLVNDENVKKALEHQKKIKEELEAAREAAEQASRERNKQRREELEERSRTHSQNAKTMSGSLEQKMGKLMKSPIMKGMVQSAVEKGAEHGVSVSEGARGWNVDPTNASTLDSREILRMARSASKKLREISKLTGRMRGVSSEAIASHRLSYTGITLDADLTQKFERLFPLQRVYVSDKAPPLIRATNILRFIGDGLLGWRPVEEGRLEGAFVGIVDESGSMEGESEITAKAIALGICFALSNAGSAVKIDRSYELLSFSSRGNGIRRVSSSQDFKAHVEWAEEFQDGGDTNFDYAFSQALETLERMDRAGVAGADMLMITDGYSRMRSDTVEAIKDRKANKGTRLISIVIGGGSNPQLEELSDVFVRVASGEDFEQNASAITVKITNAILEHEETLTSGD
jgi:uncharacterized protein with von Willebrand factor type A (vWA) domain